MQSIMGKGKSKSKGGTEGQEEPKYADIVDLMLLDYLVERGLQKVANKLSKSLRLSHKRSNSEARATAGADEDARRSTLPRLAPLFDRIRTELEVRSLSGPQSQRHLVNPKAGSAVAGAGRGETSQLQEVEGEKEEEGRQVKRVIDGAEEKGESKQSIATPSKVKAGPMTRLDLAYWGERASASNAVDEQSAFAGRSAQQMLAVKGKGFVKEKNKAKKLNWKGNGIINTATQSRKITFSDTE